MKEEVTIYDIARKLNISSATVSRALNHTKNVNSKTKERVLAAAEKMGYRQNLLASSLRKQRTHTIGVLLHEVNSNFVTSVLAGIEKVTTQEKYDILIAHSNEDGNREAANAKNLFSKRVEGLIVSLALTSSGTDHFQPYLDHDIPIVFFDRVPDKFPVTKITIDNVSGGFKATEHLIQQGYKRIGHITAMLTRNVYYDRLKGYKKALKKYHIPIDPSLIKICNLSMEESIHALEELIALQPDALFITNDFAAAVCINALRKKGIKVPQDIAIIGYNNDIIGSLISPQLSTIDYPGSLMGEVAATELFKKIHNSKSKKLTQEEKILIPSQFIARESSVKLKK